MYVLGVYGINLWFFNYIEFRVWYLFNRYLLNKSGSLFDRMFLSFLIIWVIIFK